MKKSGLFPLYLVIFFGFLGYSMMIAIFTPLLLKTNYALVHPETNKSIRTILLGVLLFLYPFGQFINAPILGAFSDRYGRKRLLCFSLFMTAVGYVFIALAVQASHLYFLMAALFFTGLFEGNVTIAQSSIADMIKDKERNRFFGYMYLSASLAYVIGPLLGGKLADVHVASWFSPALPFWIVAVLEGLILILLYFRFQETLYPKDRKKIMQVSYSEAFTNIKNIFFSRYRFLFFINFFIYLAIFGFFRSYPMYLTDTFNMDISQLSEFIAWLAVPIILVNTGVFSRFFKNFNTWQLTLFSTILVGIFIEVLVLPRSVNALWLTLFLCGFAVALCLPACATLLSTTAQTYEQGRVMGNNQSLQFFAEAVSGLIAGCVAAIFIKLSLIVLGIFAFFAVFLLFLYSETKA